MIARGSRSASALTGVVMNGQTEVRDVNIDQKSTHIDKNVSYNFNCNCSREADSAISYYESPVETFKGRRNEIQKLIHCSGILHVYGMPGVGKAEFVRKLIEENPGTKCVWFDASNEKELDKSFTSLLEHLVPRRVPVPSAFSWGIDKMTMYRKLIERKIKTIIVFDNVDSNRSKALEKYLPPNNKNFLCLTVIVISRKLSDVNLQRGAKEKICPLSHEEAIELKTEIKRDLEANFEVMPGIVNIPSTFCTIPMAGQQIGSFILDKIKNLVHGMEEYVQFPDLCVTKALPDWLQLRPYKASEGKRLQTLFSIWDEAVGHLSPTCVNVLYGISWLPSQWSPRLLISILRNIQENSEESDSLESVLCQALPILTDYCMIEEIKLSGAPKKYYVCPIVQDILLLRHCIQQRDNFKRCLTNVNSFIEKNFDSHLSCVDINEMKDKWKRWHDYVL